MSHPVFLNASSLSRMPNGEAGEWQAFWNDGREELEARHGIPVFWWCLFGSDDLKRARLIDDEDLAAEARDEPDEGIDVEATYPYLVTSQEKGLQRLEKRKAQVLAAIGREHAPAYDAFVRLIRQHFGPFILVRTSGLPDAADAGPWLSGIAAEMDGLDAGAAPGPGLAGMAEEIRRGRKPDAIRRLAGSGEDGVWPPPEVAPELGQATSVAVPPRRRNRPKEWLVEWFPGIIAAGCGIGAYAWTSSVLAGILAFAAATALLVWGMIRLQR